MFTVALLVLDGKNANNHGDALLVRCHSHQGSEKWLYFEAAAHHVLFNNKNAAVYKLIIGGDERDESFTLERIQWDIAHPYNNTHIFYKEKNGVFN
uniref:Uncharacterized protein n=1 Tax=Carcinus maenas virus 1 TaxID=2704945 RepID=A0A6G9HE73_9VIRU|nr:hypothetical protein [Carcinus maenas virus 1]